MKDYLVTILVVSAVTAVLGALPNEEKMKKTVSFALGLGVLSAVVLPLPTLLGELPSDYSAFLDRLEAGSLSGEDYLRAETMAAVGDGMAAHLAERYGLPREEVTVTVEGEIVDGTVILRRVTLRLAGRAATADIPAIVQYIEGNTGAECEVIFGEG